MGNWFFKLSFNEFHITYSKIWWIQKRLGTGKGRHRGHVFHKKGGRQGLVSCSTLYDNVSPTVSGVLDKKQALLKCICPGWMLLVWISFRATHTQQHREFQTRNRRYWSACVICWSSLGTSLFTLSSRRIAWLIRKCLRQGEVGWIRASPSWLIKFGALR